MNLLLILLVLFCTPVFASQQVTFFGSRDALHQTNTEYNRIMGGGPGSGFAPWSGTEANKRSVMPVGGTFKKMCAEVNGAPGASKSYELTLMTEGAASGLAVTISGTDVQGCASTDVSVNAGDIVSIRSVPTGSPGLADVRYSLLFQPTTDDYSVILGGTNDETPRTDATTEYCALFGSCTWGATEANERAIIPAAGTLRNLYIEYQSGSMGVGDVRAFTVMVNGSASTLTCSVTNSSLTTCSDTSNTVSVSAGDYVSLRVVSTGAIGANHVGWGLVFDPTTNGQFIASMEGAAPSTTATRYMMLTETEDSWAAGEGGSLGSGPSSEAIANTANRIHVKLTAAPNTGKSYQFALRQNGSTSSLSVTLSDATTEGSLETNVSISDNDLVNYISIPSGTPDATTAYVGIVGSIASAGAQDRRVIFNSGTGQAIFNSGTGQVLF